MVRELTSDGFRKEVFDYQEHQQWHYQAPLPCIVDFYAPWCGPCRQMAEVIEDFSKKHSDKVLLFKVNTETETEVSEVMGVQTLPTLLLIPKTGVPRVLHGQVSYEQLYNASQEIFKF